MFKNIFKKIVLITIVLPSLISCCADTMNKKTISFADSSNNNDFPVIANSENILDDPMVIYMPIVLNDFPHKNIMGAQLTEINDQNGLSLMFDANSAWTRLDYRWRVVQPTEETIEWSNASSIDQQLINAASRKMEVILILGDTPIWAKFPEWACGGKINPEKYNYFGDFIFDFINRYSHPPFNVKFYELWNEPDAADFLGCWGDPTEPYYGGEAYGEMLKVAYQSAKLANPNVEILIGGLLLDCDPKLGLKNQDGSLKDCRSANFLKGILESEAGDAFDGVAFHAYDYFSVNGSLGEYSNSNFAAKWDTTGPVTLEKAKFVRKILQDYGYSNKYLMNTEAGLLCADCDPLNKTMQITKAYYVAQEFSAALADGYMTNIWYSVYGDRNSGLMKLDNNPYPAYYAFSFTSSALQNHDFVRKIDLDPKVMGYEFISKSGTRQWVLWSIDGKNHKISLNSIPSSVHKISDSGKGEVVELSTIVVIGIAPVFLIY